jgi:DNA-binding LytR/AlgR family response regulator
MNGSKEGLGIAMKPLIRYVWECLTPFPWFMTFSRRRLVEHTLFWAAVLVFYTLYFGSRQDEYGQSLFFVVLLLPITMVTTYAVVYWLVPRYLLTGRVGRFVLYLCYSLLLSLYLELSLLVGLYMTVADYQALFVEPTLVDLMDVLIGMYVVVFGALSLHTVRRWQQTRQDQEILLQENASMQEELERIDDSEQTIALRIDRKTVHVRLGDIRYIESQGDYVLIHTSSGRLMTKQTLSALDRALSSHGFLRVHRSFLVRRAAITTHSASEVGLDGHPVPIGRSYRDGVATAMNS